MEDKTEDWKYNKPFLQFKNTSEQFWHQMVIDGAKKFCWFWLSKDHLARLDDKTGDYVFDECYVAGPVGNQQGIFIYYPIYKAQPRMKQSEIEYFANKWDSWAKQCQQAFEIAPDETIYEDDGDGIIDLGKDAVLRITPVIWSSNILIFSDELSNNYVPKLAEAFPRPQKQVN